MLLVVAIIIAISIADCVFLLAAVQLTRLKGCPAPPVDEEESIATEAA